MAKQRIINTKIWDDSYFSELKVDEKLLFIYLLTNTLTNISGIYEIWLKRIIFDTWISEKRVLEIINKFENDNKIYLRYWYIMIKNFVIYQKLNPSVKKWIEREINLLPKDILIEFYWLNKQNLTPYVQSVYSLLQSAIPNLTKPNLTKPNWTEIITTEVVTKKTLKDLIWEYINKQEFLNKWISEEILNKEMIKFYNYWSQKNPNWKKEHWEKEKTFDVKKRFITWLWNIKTNTFTNEEIIRKQKIQELENKKANLFNKI